VRVLHVDPERGWGGGEVQVTHLVRELARRGHASVVATPAGGPLARAVASEGAHVADCPIASHADLRAVPTLRRLARDADVVHFHTARAHAMAPWLGRGPRRVVTRRMDYVPRGGLWVRYLYNRAVDRVIAISGGVERALVAAGVDPARIRVVPSGVDVARFVAPPGARAALRAAWGAADGDVVALVVGVLEARKGHATLIDAAGRLGRDVPLRLVFCGTGSQEAALRAEAAARGVGVGFLGFRDDVAACLAAADVAVLPSLQEGLGVAALEAMAAGRPVVATRVGGLAEVVVDGETGRLVPAADPAALADALRTLAHDPAARARMGAAGTARVAASYSVAAMAEGTLACYRDAR
jgi:glycosyltransferase involved in cell wall biosynthesis